MAAKGKISIGFFISKLKSDETIYVPGFFFGIPYETGREVELPHFDSLHCSLIAPAAPHEPHAPLCNKTAVINNPTKSLGRSVMGNLYLSTLEAILGRKSSGEKYVKYVHGRRKKRNRPGSVELYGIVELYGTMSSIIIHDICDGCDICGALSCYLARRELFSSDFISVWWAPGS